MSEGTVAPCYNEAVGVPLSSGYGNLTQGAHMSRIFERYPPSMFVFMLAAIMVSVSVGAVCGAGIAVTWLIGYKLDKH